MKNFTNDFFGEIFVYFRQYKPANSDWYAIVIYDKRIHETPPHPRYQALVEQHLRCIYLNELSTRTEDSLAIGIAKLFVEAPTKATSLAQQLITKAREDFPDENLQKKVLAFIQAIVFYKFPNLTLEEIEAMLDLDELTNIRLYKSIWEKSRLKLTPKLRDRGMSVQEMAELLEIDIEVIRKYLRENFQRLRVSLTTSIERIVP